MKYLKTWLILLLIIISGIRISAQKVEREEAIAISEGFIKAFFEEEYRVIKDLSVHGTDEVPMIYILNLDPEGWILVAGNKGALPVIGFNYTGSFEFPSENRSNPAFNWLTQSSEELKYLFTEPADKEHDIWNEGYDALLAKDGVNVDPLISAEWGQGSGWNEHCPVDNTGPGGHALVGCVAVATAQALSIYQLPVKGVGENGYPHDLYGWITNDYSESEYSWELMSDTEPNIHTALLLYDCATSVEMKFGPESSSANTSKASSAIKTYYSFDSDAMYLSKSSYSEAKWEDIILGEIRNGRPVIYRGRSDDGESGHAFNVDGVINSDYFHINWGWNGNNNGYFYLNALNPGSRSYNTSQAAIINIRPNSTDIRDDIIDNSFVVYPIPASTTIRFKNLRDIRVENIRLFSIKGTLINSFDDIDDNSIDISSLKSGIYIIEAVLADGSLIRKKFVRQ